MILFAGPSDAQSLCGSGLEAGEGGVGCLWSSASIAALALINSMAYRRYSDAEASARRAQ